MTTASTPWLAGVRRAVQRHGSHMQTTAPAESGKTEVVAQPAVPAPTGQAPTPTRSAALTFGQTHGYENVGSRRP